ncbi:MAG TPA: hypothetical protein VMQ44_00395 [Candidatus Saccharimonadales bacterium]|nr:hypothetical protein [Candidatus Saccharimonadales bacterium]
MLALKTAKSNGFELTDRKVTVNLENAKVALGDEVFESTGEYEIGGVEAVYGQNAALIVWEQLQLVYVFNLQAPTPFEKEQFATCDILLLPDTLGELAKNIYTELLDAYDPRLVVFHKGLTMEKSFQEGLKLTETNLVKITEQTLPIEGRDLVVVG